MLFLLMLSFYNSEFEWYQLEGTGARGISEEVMESPMVKKYGKDRVANKFIYLDSGIFGGGCKVLFSKGTEIRGLPEGLRLMKRAIKMKKHDRYSALYKEGKLKETWKELEKESARKLGISSLTLEEMRKIFPEEDFKNEEGEFEPGLMLEKIGRLKCPSRTYYSFVEIEEDKTVKIIPVMIKLCPIAEKIEEYITSLNSNGD
jgi:hypothetical protein